MNLSCIICSCRQFLVASLLLVCCSAVVGQSGLSREGKIGLGVGLAIVLIILIILLIICCYCCESTMHWFLVPDWFYLSGTSSPTHPGSPGQSPGGCKTVVVVIVVVVVVVVRHTHTEFVHNWLFSRSFNKKIFIGDWSRFLQVIYLSCAQ